MTGSHADSFASPVVAGETVTLWRPRTPRTGGCGVLLLHGQGNPLQYTEQKDGAILAHAIASAGIPAVSAQMRGDAYGNAQMLTDMRDYWAMLRTHYPTLRADKVIVMGTSAGGTGAARWSQLYPAETAAVVGLIPAYDPRAGYIYSNVGDAAMEAAWGFSGLANFPAALDLASTANLAAGIPHLTAYSANDDVIPATSIIDYHTAVGGDPADLINLGNILHNYSGVSIPALCQFLVRNGA